jgi:dienelactone hydrolase
MPFLVTVLMTLVTFLPVERRAQEVPDVGSRARDTIAAMAAGEFSKVEIQFDDKMKAAWPRERLVLLWRGLSSQSGPLQRCAEESRIVAIADKRMAITRCDFERAAIDVQFAFDLTGRISGFVVRPVTPPAPAAAYDLPSYANPASYTEADLAIGSSASPLPATLTMPAGPGPFPALVLVHGSGPHDRDSTIGPNKPFKDLATGLASRGIAVLRYDKRSKVHRLTTASRAGFTVKEEVLDDVVAAVNTVRQQPRIDARRVFLLGHSLGGMLVPRIAAADGTIAGVIVMAGAARPIEQAILAQMRYLAMADGTISAEEQKGIDEILALGESLRALKPADAAGDRLLYGAPASYWLDLRGYDPPAAAAKDVKVPMLVLQGERDYQVTVEEFARWKAALSARPDVTFRSYPSLNHLFIAGTGPSLPAEYLKSGHVADEVIRDISDWLLRQTPGVRSKK